MNKYAKKTWVDAIVDEHGNVISQGTLITSIELARMEDGIESAVLNAIPTIKTAGTSAALTAADGRLTNQFWEGYAVKVILHIAPALNATIKLGSMTAFSLGGITAKAGDILLLLYDSAVASFKISQFGAGMASGIGVSDALATKLGITDAAKINVEEAIGKTAEQLSSIETDDTRMTTAKTITGAINEVFTNASNGKTLIASAITGKNVPTLPTDTYQKMANNIGMLGAWFPLTFNVSITGANKSGIKVTAKCGATTVTGVTNSSGACSFTSTVLGTYAITYSKPMLSATSSVSAISYTFYAISGVTDDKTYLYNLGDECVAFTGGYKAVTYLSPTMTKNVDNLFLSATSDSRGNFVTNNAINFTNYSTLKGIVSTTGSRSKFVDIVMVQLNNTSNDNTQPSGMTIAYWCTTNDVNNTDLLISIDVSNINTTAYFGMWAVSYVGGTPITLTVKKAWLE